MSQHVAGSRLTSNIKITLKIKFTSEIFADITRSLVVVLQHLRFCKKILILIFFSDLFSVECKFFCPNSADNTMENRAISLVESSRDNSLISCPTSSGRDHAFGGRYSECVLFGPQAKILQVDKPRSQAILSCGGKTRAEAGHVASIVNSLVWLLIYAKKVISTY